MAKRRGAEPREARRARAAEAERRARMYVRAHLAWIEGFPSEIRWWRLDGSAPFVVDRALLARARRALRTVLGEHRDALAEAVGDVARWAAATEEILDALGAAVHTGGAVASQVGPLEPATARLARSIAAAEPALAPTVEALAIALHTRPDARTAALRWLDARTEPLARLVTAVPGPPGVLAVLRLAGLAAAEGAAAVDPLVALVCADVIEVPRALVRGKDLIAQLKQSGAPPPRPPLIGSSRLMADWLGRLCAAETPGRRRALALLALVDLGTQATAVRGWWQRAQRRFAQAQALMVAAADREADSEFVAGCVAAIEDVIKQAVPWIELVPALAAVESTAWGDAAAQYAPLRRLVAQVPQSLGPLARIRMLAEITDDTADNLEHLGWLFDALAAELERGAADAERMLTPWMAVIDGSGGVYTSHLRAAMVRRPDGKRAAALFTACARRTKLTYEVVRRAMLFVPLTVDPDVVAHIVENVIKIDDYIDGDMVRAAVTLGAEAGADTAALLGELARVCADETHRASGELARLVEHARASGALWVIHRMLGVSKGRSVLHAAAIAASVPRNTWPPLLAGGGAARWIEPYPEALHGPLRRLAAADPAAEEAARKILRRDLPHPEEAARELAALRAGRSTSPSAGGRVRRLEAGSRLPGAVRLGRLAERLEQVAAQIALDRFIAAVTAVATTRIAESAGLPAWPGWPLDRSRIAVLTALTKLAPRPRELAATLLRRRAGSPPWDLRDHPRNAAFLAGLRGRGIELAPWLDDTTRAVRGKDGAPLTLGFTADPLDIFAMGEPWGTCLAASGVNFFSVVTNAADINKRVLYVRRADGVTAGRCLFALTDAGRILTFNVYEHGDHEIRALVQQFAIELAARMGTEIVGTGNVSILLAEDWYDDGALDLTNRFPALAADTPLRKALADLPLADIPARLAAELDHPLDDVTLPMVLGMTEVGRRPEIVKVLAPMLLAAGSIPDETMVVAARFALAAGDRELAARLVAGRARPEAIRESPRWLGDVLAQVQPSLALAMLRATRERGVHGWEQEPVERLAVAARAMEHLNRPRKAAALYRIAIAQGWKSLADELRPRLAALTR